MKRLSYAFQMFWMALTKRKLFQIGLMKTVADILKFMEETAKENHPMTCDLNMTHIANITLEGKIETEEKPVLYLWCGIAGKPSPILRCRELIEENKILRELLNKKQNPDSSTGGDNQNPPHAKP